METSKKQARKRIDIGRPKKIHPSIKRGTYIKLMAALRFFAEENRRLDMKVYGKFIPNPKSAILPPCGTTACLAGSVLLLAKDKLSIEFLAPYLREKKIEEARIYGSPVLFPRDTDKEAKRILGITSLQAKKLFYFRYMLNANPSKGKSGWPAKFDKAYLNATGDKERFEATKGRVFYFLETGK